MTETIVLGGGCFWCTEAVFNRVPGVIKATSGYAGGTKANPTYEEVCSGDTGHAEVVKVEFDPAKTDLREILKLFFLSHDPTQLNRQGNDTGTQYRSIILYDSERQKLAAESYINGISKDYDKPVVTEIKKLEMFYPAEEYHRDYYENNKASPYCYFVIRPKLDKLKNETEASG